MARKIDSMVVVMRWREREGGRETGTEGAEEWDGSVLSREAAGQEQGTASKQQQQQKGEQWAHSCSSPAANRKAKPIGRAGCFLRASDELESGREHRKTGYATSLVVARVPLLLFS